MYHNIRPLILLTDVILYLMEILVYLKMILQKTFISSLPGFYTESNKVIICKI